MKDKLTVVAAGEVLWDMFPDAARFGGAPANYACHAAALGAKAYVVSCVGNDSLGARALHFLQENGVHISAIARSATVRTGTVDVTLDADGKPEYEIGANVAWDQTPWSEPLSQLATSADAICFGTLGQRSEVSRSTIRRLVGLACPDCLRILDVNLRQDYFDRDVVLQSLSLANVLKLNDEELPIVASFCGISGTHADMLAELERRFELRGLVLTRGDRGAVLMRDGVRSECDGIQVDVKDSVGAGDAFTAAMTLGLLMHNELDAINQYACRVAAYVCSQSGAVPEGMGQFEI